MAKSYLKVNDKKWRELKRQIPAVKGAEVTVGVQSDAGASQDGTPIAAYAAYNEFGTDGRTPRRGGWGGPIPARPFLGSTFDDRRSAWGKGADVAIDRALTGLQSFERGLVQLGELAERDVKDTITATTSPPNSALTIELKGSDKPLTDTGALRTAIRYEVKL